MDGMVEGMADTLDAITGLLRREKKREPSLDDIFEALGQCVALAYVLRVQDPDQRAGMDLAIGAASEAAVGFHSGWVAMNAG